MPTEIQPHRSRRLSWRQATSLMGLLVRGRILNWRMTRADARLSDREDAADSATLLVGAREWVRLHIRLAKLFDMLCPRISPNCATCWESRAARRRPNRPALHTPTARRLRTEVAPGARKLNRNPDTEFPPVLAR